MTLRETRCHIFSHGYCRYPIVAVGLLRADTGRPVYGDRKQALLITRPDARHRILLPDEITPRSAINAHGGTDAADSGAW